MKTLTLYALAFIAAMPPAVLAAPHAPEIDVGANLAPISAPAEKDRVRISVSFVGYPGAPDHAACRMRFRAVNESRESVDLATQFRTFDTFKNDLDSWLIPTGVMAPGQAVERTYSCKQASFVTLDQQSSYGWPRTCVVNGQSQSPCRVAMKVDFNLPQYAR